MKPGRIISDEELKKLDRLEDAIRKAECSVCGKPHGWNGTITMNYETGEVKVYCGEHIPK